MSANSKSPTGNFFEDFYIGQVFHHATPRTISDGDSALYIALTGARQVLSSADTVSHAMGYQRRVVDDLLAFHIALGKTVPDISINAVANLGYADVRFLQPVYVGDTLTTSGIDGVYPPGLLVARVTRVERRAGSMFARVLAEPLASAQGVRHVLVLEPVGKDLPARPEPDRPRTSERKGGRR